MLSARRQTLLCSVHVYLVVYLQPYLHLQVLSITSRIALFAKKHTIIMIAQKMANTDVNCVEDITEFRSTRSHIEKLDPFETVQGNACDLEICLMQMNHEDVKFIMWNV